MLGKKQLLQNSLRTNCSMVRAMCKLNQKTLAERYLKNARKDKKKLDELNRQWKLDATKTLTIEV
jgi:hypothetical protein